MDFSSVSRTLRRAFVEEQRDHAAFAEGGEADEDRVGGHEVAGPRGVEVPDADAEEASVPRGVEFVGEVLLDFLEAGLVLLGDTLF